MTDHNYDNYDEDVPPRVRQVRAPIPSPPPMPQDKPPTCGPQPFIPANPPFSPAHIQSVSSADMVRAIPSHERTAAIEAAGKITAAWLSNRPKTGQTVCPGEIEDYIRRFKKALLEE